ncbi:regulatory signaling modulator protein AmpE [Guyparkeria sp. TX1]|uniref:regulatory signaling modulator protein AmpE n=1 Tax=Guyparkeria sp. TX1 TaxID=3115001 RepID=UPI003977BCC3
MKLLVLILVVAIDRFLEFFRRWRADRWPHRATIEVFDTLAGMIGSTAARLIVWLLLPVALLILLGAGGDGWIGWVVSLVVLLLVITPRNTSEINRQLLDAAGRDDQETVESARKVLFDGTPVDPAAATTRQTGERIIVLAFREWFLVLFWFVLLGPAGALFYRLTEWLAQENDPGVVEGAKVAWLHRWQKKTHALLVLPAAPVFTVLMLLAGSFQRGVNAWRGDPALGREHGAMDGWEAGSIGLIARVGHAVIDVERADECLDENACLADQRAWYRAAHAIVLRALLFGLALVAVLTMIGWVP